VLVDAADVRLLAGGVDVVGAHVERRLDHRRAVERERAGAVDDRLGAAERLAQRLRVVDGGRPHRPVDADLAGQALQLAAVAAAEHGLDPAVAQLQRDQPPRVAGRAVQRDPRHQPPRSWK
jgi:3',5'-cyclic AMP phosphodiesterase CpdA